ncbi:P-loop containing nucleoside triphosphate hydrolase protein [Flammula alnicola]|nr:P-loop containing nucleoside triphosphate hydrolase protein [Flammula alnicola]
MANKSMKKWGRNTNVSVLREVDPVIEGDANDIVIPVMGPTGVGKSSFINSLLGPNDQKLAVGHGLSSCTSDVSPVIITDGHYGQLTGRRLVMVDTPGFDDTSLSDTEILRRISVWLAASYSSKMKLGGVVYLDDITQTCPPARKDLDTFQKLVGKDALKSTVLGTTKWSIVKPNDGVARQRELECTYWTEMINAGSRVFRIDEGERSARNIVNCILSEIGQQGGVNRFLRIQSELVDMQKIIPETDAGRTLKYSLDELIEMQKQRARKLRARAVRADDEELRRQFVEGEKQLGQLVQEAKEMKVPLSRRIKKFFGMA